MHKLNFEFPNKLHFVQSLIQDGNSLTKFNTNILLDIYSEENKKIITKMSYLSSEEEIKFILDNTSKYKLGLFS